ncbi:MAG: ketoacyl-ACP synthase III [Paludibacter sp.]|nr:ketoacyl-ACP synthase III [Paludibacter sp.]
MSKAFLQAISYYLPKKCLTNEELSLQHPEWSVDKIALKTGIHNRYLSAPDETAGDMAMKAAERLFDEYNIDRSKIDFVLLCTQSPDYFLPTTACIVQDRLGLSKNCGALDFNLGCSGFIYGLGLAKGLLFSGQAKNILLITSETYTKNIHPLDKSNKTIFGDGATASLVSSTIDDLLWNAEIQEFSYATDGSGHENLIIRNGGFRNKTKKEALDVYLDDVFIKNDDFLYMDGKAIFDFTAFEVPKLVEQNLILNESSTESIDLFIFHQANQYMLNFMRKRCKIPTEKFYIDISDGGNTVSNTIPIALKRASKKKVLQKEFHIQLCGFGVGLSMGAVTLKF